jgi:hypothetical protein
MFTIALEELERSESPVSMPESFTQYCNRTRQVVPRNVPGRISPQSLSSLDRELRESNVMVFRLGSPPGTNTTQFGLARTAHDWSDYFLIDDRIFEDVSEQAFIPTSLFRDLYAFSLIPRFTETTMVNFALASGLLREALSLDQTPSIPVTGRSTYTFSFFPRFVEDSVWTHHAGQVEIDGAFTARRNGIDCLFIVEAKNGQPDSLAKTKLLYPYLALRPQIPEAMPIVLVYLRATATKGGITYRVSECSTPSPAAPTLIEMKPSSPRVLTVAFGA